LQLIISLNIVYTFYICGSVHHQSILLNTQREAALSSCIYSSLQGYSTCFGVLSAPIIRGTIKTADAIIGTANVPVWFKPVDVQGLESISQCHGQLS
jgi:hypothetical protein